MASETMTREDIYRELAKGEDADGLYHVQMDEMADEIIRLRAALAPQGDRAQMFVCGGTPTPERQKELDDFATYLRVKGRIDAQQKLAPQGVTVTEAMVEVACAAFSREWYEDVEARPMRVALTAALRAAGVGA